MNGSTVLKAFSFVHAADLHLGYTQYGLEAILRLQSELDDSKARPQEIYEAHEKLFNHSRTSEVPVPKRRLPTIRRASYFDAICLSMYLI